MSNVKSVSEQEFEAEVLKSVLPVLVDFWAEWCGPCRLVGPVVEALGTKFAGKLKTVKVNTDESPAIAGRYEINAIPTLIVFKNGKEVKRLVGFKPQPALESELLDIL